MKKTILSILLIAIVLILSVSCELLSDPISEGTTRVIVVGLDYSDYDSEFSLDSGSNDASALAYAFESLGQNTSTNVEVTRMIQSKTIDTQNQSIIYPNRENLIKEIERIQSISTGNDTTIFYFSGLGIAESDETVDGRALYYGPRSLNFSSEVDYSDEYYFLLGNNGNTDANGISGQELLDKLNNVKGISVLLSDTSNSGSLVSGRSTTVDTVDFNCNTEVLLDSFNNADSNDSKVRVLTSSRRYETSRSTRSIDGVEHGTFTSCLLEGLNYDSETKTIIGVPKAASGKALTLDGLYSWISENDKDSSQTPKITGDPVDIVLFTF
ncbi:MAG: hypothetical protein WC162_08410 [Sphaerochaetaceae bacterium]|nr:caspase family protein [Sphaerochaetaceae bacterium]